VSASFRAALPWVCFVALLFMLSYGGRVALSPLLPYLEEDFGVGHSTATSLLLMQGLGMTLSMVMAGYLLSRVRPRNLASLSLILSGLCFMSMPLCSGMGIARIAFFLVGFMSGLYFAAGMTTLGSLVSYKDWGKAVGIHELAPNLGFILFPLFAQMLLAFTSWKGVLAVWGALMCLTGMLFLRYGRGGTEYAERPSMGGNRHLLHHPTLWMFMVIMTVALIGEYAVYIIVPLHLVGTFHLSPEEASYIVSVSRLAAPAMVIVGGWAADAFPVRRVLVFAFVLHTLALVAVGTPDLTVAIGGIAAQASAIAMAYPGLFKLISECYPTGRQPMVLSLVIPASALFGSGLAPNLLGLAGETIGFGPGMLVVAALSLVCVPLVLSARRLRE